MPGTAFFTQDAFRFYDDTSGGESGNTAVAAQNTSITRIIMGDNAICLRLGIQEGGLDNGVATDDWQLQYSKNGGAYADVTTSSSNVKALNSTNLTDADPTTNRLTGLSGSFVPGLISEDGLADNLQITISNFSEFLFPLTLIFADLTNGDTLDFRLLCAGGVINGYTVTPRITISKGDVSGPGGEDPSGEESSSSSDRRCKSIIRITDHTGRLPKNPKDWPAELKAAVAECCCCAEKTTGEPQPIVCCPGITVPDRLTVTVAGSRCHNGSYPVTFTPNRPAFEPLGVVWDGLPFGAWLGDIYEDFSYTCEEISNVLGCVLKRVATYTYYYIPFFGGGCSFGLFQYAFYQWVDSVVSGGPGCNSFLCQSLQGCEGYLGLTGLGRYMGSFGNFGLPCAVKTCDPFSILTPFQYPLLNAPELLCSIDCGGNMTAEPNASCNGANINGASILVSA